MIQNSGYIKLWRKSMGSVIWQNANLWRFWSWCLMKATHKPIRLTVNYEQITLNPGQLLFGRKKCSRETGLSEWTIRTCIKTLEGSKTTTQTTNRYTIITIINWEHYQSNEKVNHHPNHQQPTSNPPATHQQPTTNNNNKHKKNEKKKTYMRKNSTNESKKNKFDEFWTAYPKKKSKGQAEKAFCKINPDQKLFERILKAIDQARQSREWQRENGQFIPYPATWLNAEGWEDEMVIDIQHKPSLSWAERKINEINQRNS